MHRKSVLERIEKDLEGLSPQEQLKLMEMVISKLMKGMALEKRELDWDELYGLGRGLWKEDAQEYVNRLREERI